MMILIKVRDIAEAIAAPTIPSGGMREIFRSTFTIVAVRTDHIINLESPMANNVPPLGPNRFLTMKPMDRIRKAGVAVM